MRPRASAACVSVGLFRVSRQHARHVGLGPVRPHLPRRVAVVAAGAGHEVLACARRVTCAGAAATVFSGVGFAAGWPEQAENQQRARDREPYVTGMVHLGILLKLKGGRLYGVRALQSAPSFYETPDAAPILRRRVRGDAARAVAGERADRSTISRTRTSRRSRRSPRSSCRRPRAPRGASARWRSLLRGSRTTRKAPIAGTGTGTRSSRRPTGPSPAARYPAQFAALDQAAREQGAASFAAAAARRAAHDRRARAQHASAREAAARRGRPARISSPTSWACYFSSAEAMDLCYSAEIGRDTLPRARQAPSKPPNADGRR